MWQLSDEDQQLRNVISDVFDETFSSESLYKLDENTNSFLRLDRLALIKDLALDEYCSDHENEVFYTLCHIAQKQGQVLAPLDMASQLLFQFMLPRSYSVLQQLEKCDFFCFAPSQRAFHVYNDNGSLKHIHSASVGFVDVGVAKEILKTHEQQNIATFHTESRTNLLSVYISSNNCVLERNLDFSSVLVELDVNHEGAFQLSLEDSRYCLALQSILRSFALCGIAQRVLQLAVNYTRERKQFDVPVGGFQAVQHKLSDVCLRVESMTALSELAAINVKENCDQLYIAADAAIRYARKHILDIIETCIQVHGGTGYTWEYPLHHYLRRALYYKKSEHSEGVSLILNQLSNASQKA